jgi:hypothetical protein
MLQKVRKKPLGRPALNISRRKILPLGEGDGCAPDVPSLTGDSCAHNVPLTEGDTGGGTHLFVLHFPGLGQL